MFWKDHIPRHKCPKPEKDYIYLNLRGTTFSGLSTRTTLGNTQRSYLYVCHYLIEAGISDEPWLDKRILIIAAGDDTVVFCEPQLAERIRDAIFTRTSRTTDRQTVGLG